MERGECTVQIDHEQLNNATIFEPNSSISINKVESSNVNSVCAAVDAAAGAPEKKLTLFALRLAIFEKAATGLGTLGFIWATVVLLGGFAITLDTTDFWCITIILLVEGTRIFSRSHELEWQHQATWSNVGRYSFRALKTSSRLFFSKFKAVLLLKRNEKPRSGDPTEAEQGKITGRKSGIRRTWTSSDVPLLPYARWVFIARNVSKLLYWLQLLSATACVVLSSTKLIKHNYGEVAKGDTDKRNRQAALNIFYSLALSEALLFLMEKCYWEYKVSYCKLLEEVNKECEFGVSGLVSIRRFFYDAYSKCVEGSIFDGLKMDIVSFAMDLLGSNSPDEQLIGARILRQLSINERFSDDTLQKIGITLSVIERLVEMLNWTDPEEEEIRKSAAEILSKLAGKKQNSLRVTGIPGAMESISSLLQTNRVSSGSCGAADEIGERRKMNQTANYEVWTFNHLGLVILKKLARDHDNCGKIGNTRGLLTKIIDFAHAGPGLLRDGNVTTFQVLTVKRSLQVMKMLASTTGTTGEHLRKEMSEIVFTISNIRDILRHGEKHPLLQKLGIEILTSLSLEADATERIGATGGVIKELLIIFLKDGIEESVRIAAGEALAMLVLESTNNCGRVMKLNVLNSLIGALEVPLLRVNAARILRNLCKYSGPDCSNQLKEIKTAAPTVLRAIVSEEAKLQEVIVGVATHVFKLMSSRESTDAFENVGIKEAELCTTLVNILRKYQTPSVKVPQIRRFTIELAIWMMRERATNVQTFKELEMEKELEGVLESTAELENFNIFSGTVGMSRHKTTLHSLVETALELLADQ